MDAAGLSAGLPAPTNLPPVPGTEAAAGDALHQQLATAQAPVPINVLAAVPADDAAPTDAQSPAPAPHPPVDGDASASLTEGLPASAKPPKRKYRKRDRQVSEEPQQKKEGAACRATYCDSRICAGNPSVDVPRRDLERRRMFLLRIWQTCEGDRSDALLERVDKEIADTKERLAKIEAKKDQGEKVKDEDYPRRIRICKTHFPEGSFTKTTAEYEKLTDTALPFSYRQHMKAVQEAEEERKRKAHEMEEAERERKAEEMARKKRKKAELLEEFKSTKSEMDELKAQLTSQTETINQLQQTNASLQMQLGAQQSRIAELDAVNREWDVRFKALAEATVPKLTFASVADSDDLANEYTPFPTAESLKILLNYCKEFRLHWAYDGRDAEGNRHGALPKVPFQEALLQALMKYRRTFNDKHIARLCGVPSHHLIARNYKKITALLNQMFRRREFPLSGVETNPAWAGFIKGIRALQ